LFGTRGEPTGDRKDISQFNTTILRIVILPMISGQYEEEKRCSNGFVIPWHQEPNSDRFVI
jgi:hypothetical protein